MKATPRAIVKEAIRLMSVGTSTCEVAQQLNISNGTASNIYSSNKENMPVNKGGRPRKIQAETVEHLKLSMKRGTLRTAKGTEDKAHELLEAPFSTITIRRRLREAGLTAKGRSRGQHSNHAISEVA
ncbi:hypothetical protein BGX23_004465 [Mortierella sp. AD031]|nr:hypothetical protein BGX23_004465 [Mortierella sp. AD031]